MSVKRICENIQDKAQAYADFIMDYVKTKNRRPIAGGCHAVAQWEAEAVYRVLESKEYWDLSKEIPLKLHQSLWHVIGVPDIESLKVFLLNSPGRELLKDGFERYQPKDPNSLWHYRSSVYEITSIQADEETKLLILEEVDNESQKYERLRRKFESTASREIQLRRLPISEEVRNAVWRRDEGKCASCGSRENLEFDHIIPVSKGGSSTVRNVELLCEKCNRAKGDRI